MVEVADIREGIIIVMRDNPEVTKYRLAKDLNLSSATHINNFLTGETKRPRTEVYKLLFRKYDVLVAAYKESSEYKAMMREDEGPKEIKI